MQCPKRCCQLGRPQLYHRHPLLGWPCAVLQTCPGLLSQSRDKRGQRQGRADKSHYLPGARAKFEVKKKKNACSFILNGPEGFKPNKNIRLKKPASLGGLPQQDSEWVSTLDSNLHVPRRLTISKRQAPSSRKPDPWLLRRVGSGEEAMLSCLRFCLKGQLEIPARK